MLIVLFISCISLRPTKINSNEKLEMSYKVYKIDSINNWYVIYARRKDSLYKIISGKVLVENCSRIKVNKNYQFQLHSRIYGNQVAGMTMSPQYSLLVTCFAFDDSTNICLERDSINDLYYADNIKGLCFEQKP